LPLDRPLGAIRKYVKRAWIIFGKFFETQAEALEERGVDFFILETFSDPKSSVRGPVCGPYVLV